MLEEVNWLAGQLSKTFEARAPLNSIVVSNKLRVSFLKQRHPEGAEIRFVSKWWNKVILRVDVLVLHWKTVIDVDGHPFFVVPEVVSEDTLLIVSIERVSVNDSSQSPRFLGDGTHTWKEPTIRYTTLFDTHWLQLTESAKKAWFFIWVDFMRSQPSNDFLVVFIHSCLAFRRWMSCGINGIYVCLKLVIFEYFFTLSEEIHVRFPGIRLVTPSVPVWLADVLGFLNGLVPNGIWFGEVRCWCCSK